MSAGAAGQTLLLDLTNWDLVIDSNSNIARADPPYALAQDVASAARTFLGEVWFDDTVGVPYLQSILGKRPPLPFVQAQLVAAALTVPGVLQAECIITGFTNTTPVVQTSNVVLDSSGNPVLDSSGNPVLDISTSGGGTTTANGRALSGQILFTDATGQQLGVSL